jgi:hypothetical protein
MRSHHYPKILVLLTFLALSTGSLVAADTQPAGTNAASGFEPIRYERTGGFVGTRDVVEIGKDGTLAVSGKLLGKATGKLTSEQMQRLALLFSGWKSLKQNYPAPQGSADGFEFKIRYGTTEVSASEMNRDLPEKFRAARTAIEKLAQDAAGKQ